MGIAVTGTGAVATALAPSPGIILAPSPAITVAICAYTLDRWELLQAAIDSVAGQLRPGDECLVVVDHNETLRQRLVQTVGDRPVVRVMASTGPRGLSGARNCAVAHSDRPLLAFLDDDAVAEPGWLERIRGALADTDVLVAGTAALPRWPAGSRPRWFPPEFDWVVGCSYTGMPAADRDVRNVIGAAMGFRREAFEIAGEFSTAVGRIGTMATGCEETELCIRLRRARPQARIRYLPTAAVLHTVSPDRLRLAYFVRRCLGEGRSKARVSRLVGAGDGLSDERRYVRAVLPRGVLRQLGRGLRGQVGGFGGAAVIVLGVLVAATGYLSERLSRRGGG
jgi:GT2 family glycosyltransferase